MRALPKYLGTANSVQNCANEAAQRNFAVFAVQNRRECWSSPNGEDTYDRYGTTDRCNDGVGAGWANDVYKFVSISLLNLLLSSLLTKVYKLSTDVISGNAFAT